MQLTAYPYSDEICSYVFINYVSFRWTWSRSGLFLRPCSSLSLSGLLSKVWRWKVKFAAWSCEERWPTSTARSAFMHFAFEQENEENKCSWSNKVRVLSPSGARASRLRWGCEDLAHFFHPSSRTCQRNSNGNKSECGNNAADQHCQH